MAPPQYLAGRTFFFGGREIDVEALRDAAGVRRLPARVAGGRAGRIRVPRRPDRSLPNGSALPYRLDLLDDELETIRTFDLDTQRASTRCRRSVCCPAGNSRSTTSRARPSAGRWRDRFEGDPSQASVYKDVGNGIASPGIEYYLPLFFDETATLFEYLPADAVVVLHGAIEAAIQRFWSETSERLQFPRRDADAPDAGPGRPVPDRRGVLRARQGRTGGSPWAKASRPIDSDRCRCSRSSAAPRIRC